MEHLSITQLKTFLTCPLRYKYRYIDGLKIPPGIGLILGKSAHVAIGANYKQKKETKQDMKVDDFTELFVNNYEHNLVSEEVQKNEDPDKAKDDGVRTLKVYHKDRAVSIQPRDVELPFELTFENVNYSLKGRIDLITDKKQIIDHKITSRSQTPDQYNYDPQLIGYGLGYKSLFGEYPKQLEYDILVRKKEPIIQQFPIMVYPEKYVWFLQLLGKIAMAIETGIFYPIVSNDWRCTDKYCGYAIRCKKGEW